uniref:SAM domain-containing protein n=1 Tax=Glossina brevipalpis TaxID=37001 RepID=A0A1A9X1G6_9MUSC
MQMQLAAAAADAGGGGTPNSPATQQTPSSAAAAVAAMQQHSTTISTMSPMQLATTTGQVAAAGDWAQGRTVQLMQPSTGFLYPHMLVPGNLIQSGLGQQPIQVITAGKPFQGSAPQMITTTQNTKQMAIGGNTGFPSGTTYAIPSSQSPQTLLFSPVNVISQSPQQQQQNILQAMTAAAQQQQQQQQQQKGAIESQKSMQPKVMQKLTTATTNSVQSAAAGGVGQQQQQPTTQQCVQVNTQTGMPAGTTQIISPLQGTTGAPQPLQINAAPWVQSVPFWPNGLQQLTQNPIIIRGTQPDGTQGVFIQQPTGQALQAQQPNPMASMMNAAAGGGSTSLTSTSSGSSMGTTITTTTVPTSIASSSMSHQNTASASLPSTPNKVSVEQVKAVSSAPSTPTTVALTTSLSAPSTPSSCNESNQKETSSKVVGTEANKISSSDATLTTNTFVSSVATGTVTTANSNSLPEIPQQIVTPIDTTPASETSIEHQLITKTQQIQPSTTSPITVTANSLEISTSPAKSVKSTSESDSMISTAIVVSTTPEDTTLSASVGTTTATSSAPTIATSSAASTTSTTTFVNNSISTTTSTTTTNTTSLKSISTSSVPSKSTTGANAVKAEKDLPKAMIKPNVLTHVIDGFIIQEANEPFPVTRQRYTDRETNDEPPKKKLALDDGNINNNNNNSLSVDLLSSDMVACEQCGKPEHKAKLKKKRFCSPTCARLAKNSANDQSSGQVVQQQSVDNGVNNSSITAMVTNDNINGSNIDLSTNSLTAGGNIGVNVEKMQTESTGNNASPLIASSFTNSNLSATLPITMTTPVSEVGTVPQITTAPIVESTPQMANWSVADVCEFIKNLPGCSDYVDDFEQQEIDGQALLLLKENHLVNAMGMKLGPALKIVAKVESMKEVTTAALNAANNSPNENNQQ